jgi:hypothetical protein
MALLSAIITPTNLVTANSSIALVNKTLTAPVINSPTGIVKGDVGLGNVDNTSDATKNSATSTLTNKTLTSPVINSPTGIVKGDVGLGNVDNTSDATKNAATATLTNKTLTAPTIASANLTTALTLAGAAGTNGQVLTSAGSGLPSWTTPSSGALTLLSTVTASTSATVDVETTFDSTYDAYLIVGTGITQTAVESLNVRMKIGGTYISTATYKYHIHAMVSAYATYDAVVSSADSNILVSGQYPSTGAEQSIDFIMRVYTPTSTAFTKMIDWQGVTTTNNSPIRLMGFSGAGYNTGTGALTGMRFLFGAGNILAGKFRLYGIANS